MASGHSSKRPPTPPSTGTKPEGGQRERLTFDLKPLKAKLDELAAKGLKPASIRFVPKKPN